MYKRFDRVIHKTFWLLEICTFIITEKGIYLIHTGRALGLVHPKELPNPYANSYKLSTRISGEITRYIQGKQFPKERSKIETAEARIKQNNLKRLVKDNNRSKFISWADVKGITVRKSRMYETPGALTRPTLVLRTKEGDFVLSFWDRDFSFAEQLANFLGRILKKTRGLAIK